MSPAERMAKSRELRKAGKIPVLTVLDESDIAFLVGCGLLRADLSGDKAAIAAAHKRLILLLRATPDARVWAYLKRATVSGRSA